MIQCKFLLMSSNQNFKTFKKMAYLAPVPIACAFSRGHCTFLLTVFEFLASLDNGRVIIFAQRAVPENSNIQNKLVVAR